MRDTAERESLLQEPPPELEGALRRGVIPTARKPSHRGGIELGSDVPIRTRLTTLAARLRETGAKNLCAPIAHIHRLVRVAYDVGRFDDATYLAVRDCEDALERLEPIGTLAAYRGVIHAALAVIAEYRKEIEP